MKKIDLQCVPQDVAVKSFFLGPSAENREWITSQVTYILNSWFDWRKNFSTSEGCLISDSDKAVSEFKTQQKWSEDVIANLVKRFESEIPKFSPRYIGHMFSEISMPALLGHIITLLHNPNNISSEASTVGTEIEKEAIYFLSELVGYKQGTGHFTSGGTVANFEFLFRARERLFNWLNAAAAAGEKDLFAASIMGWSKYNTIIDSLGQDKIKKVHPAKAPVLLVSSSKHYSWPKGMHYLGLGEENLIYVDLDQAGRMSVIDLYEKLKFLQQENIPLLGVVGIAGTTELGTIDPISEIADALKKFTHGKDGHIWFHIDAAYGGFFRSLVKTEPAANLEPATFKNLLSMSEADSVTLDPHKLGYVPYASGAFICKNSEDYFIKPFTGPYIKSDRHNLGNFTIEGSRSAAGAVATYTSMKCFQGSDGYARILARTMLAKDIFKKALQKTEMKILFPEGQDTNILCFSVVAGLKNLSQVNSLNLRLYERITEENKYWISKTTLTKHYFNRMIHDSCMKESLDLDSEEMVLLRLTLMNPFIISKESPVDHATRFAELINHVAYDLNHK